MVKSRGSREDPCRAPFLRRRNLRRLLLAVVRVKLRFPTSSMIMRTMCLSGRNRSSLQVEAAMPHSVGLVSRAVEPELEPGAGAAQFVWSRSSTKNQKEPDPEVSLKVRTAVLEL